jgi:hypothetical protein
MIAAIYAARARIRGSRTSLCGCERVDGCGGARMPTTGSRVRRSALNPRPGGLIFSLAKREPDARFCCPGHARRWAESVS